MAPPTPFQTIDYGYALAPGETSLLDRVNTFLDAIKQDGRLLRFARKHLLDPVIVTK